MFINVAYTLPHSLRNKEYLPTSPTLRTPADPLLKATAQLIQGSALTWTAPSGSLPMRAHA